MNRFFRHRLLLTGVAIMSASILLAVGISWLMAHVDLQSTFDFGFHFVRERVNCAVESGLYFTTRNLMANFNTVERLADEDLDGLAELYGVDELNVVDCTGMVVASSVPKLVGASFSSHPLLMEFTALTNGIRRHLSQNFRRGIYNPDAHRMYVGLAFPGRDGLIQVGFDESRLEPMLVEMLEGQSMKVDSYSSVGDFVLVDPETWRVELSSDSVPIRRFQSISDFGVKPDVLLAAADANRILWLHFGDRRYLARTERILGHLLLLIVPMGEVLYWFWCFFFLVGLLLLVTVAAFGYVIIRLRRESKRVAQLRQVEDERRIGDMRMAASIQANAMPQIFPPFPDLVGKLDLFARMMPARLVGGDFYDFRRVGVTRVQLTVADVSGKGVPAAMCMMRAKETLSEQVSGRKDLAESVAAANEALCVGNDDGMFITAWIGILDVVTGRLEYVNAGHNPPLVRRADGRIEWLSEGDPDMPLAAMEGMSYRKHVTDLAPGDAFFAYTDGVTEAADATGELFGDARLQSVLGPSVESAERLCELVEQAIRAHEAGAIQADDVTMLALVLKGSRGVGGLTARRVTVPGPDSPAAVGRVSAVFPATPEGAASSAGFLERIVSNPDAAIVLDEIVSNIVRCSRATEFEVAVAGETEMTFSDNGIAFDPLGMSAPDVEAGAEDRTVGGLGIYIVRQLSESVRYERKNGRNVLKVRLKPAS